MAILTSCAIAFALLRVSTIRLNADVAWLHYIASRVIEGDTLYVDFIEINPPLIVWLSMPTAWLDIATELPYTITFPVVVGAAALLSLVFSRRLSARILGQQSNSVLTFGLALMLFVMPWPVWGQREHLMMILTMPYLVAAAVRLRGERVSEPWLIGIAAGIGYCIKPHFVLVFLLVEGYCLWRLRTLWLGALIVTLVGGVYAVAVLLRTPEYLPMAWALREDYSGFVRRPGLKLVAFYPRLLLPVACLSLAFLRGRETQELRVTFALATLAYALCLFIQAKGFLYHYMPVMAGGAVLTILVLVERRRWAIIVGGAILVATALRPANPWEVYFHYASLEAQGVMRGQPVMVLSNDVSHIWPAVSYARSRWPARVPALWPFRADTAAYARGVQWALEGLRSRPTVLVPYFERFSVLEPLLSDPRFREVWASYQFVDSLDFFAVYKAGGMTLMRPAAAIPEQ